MRVQVFGAAGEVTGSSYLVETQRARVLVDFGMFQGRDEDEETPNDLPDEFDADKLDAMPVTHAHSTTLGGCHC
jgi:metallo-beta-lactamase family protein